MAAAVNKVRPRIDVSIVEKYLAGAKEPQTCVCEPFVSLIVLVSEVLWKVRVQVEGGSLSTEVLVLPLPDVKGACCESCS